MSSTRFISRVPDILTMASGQIRSAASGQSLSTASGQSDTASGQSGTASGHGSSVLYALVGLHANTYSLEAELFPLVRTRDTSAGVMVLRFQVDATTQPRNTPWPRIVSETGWLLPLARQAPPLGNCGTSAPQARVWASTWLVRVRS